MDARCHTLLCSLCSRFTCALALHSLCHMAHKVLAGAAVRNWGRALWWDSKHSERFSQGLTLRSHPRSLNPADLQLSIWKRAIKSSNQIIVLQQLETLLWFKTLKQSMHAVVVCLKPALAPHIGTLLTTAAEPSRSRAEPEEMCFCSEANKMKLHSLYSVGPSSEHLLLPSPTAIAVNRDASLLKEEKKMLEYTA